MADYVYRSGHVEFLRRKREWFDRYGTAYMVLWWVPAGHRPTVAEAVGRLARLDAHGPTANAFTFAESHSAPTFAAPTSSPRPPAAAKPAPDPDSRNTRPA